MSRPKKKNWVLRGVSLMWRRDGADWVLLAGRRCFGRVVPDSKCADMWRSKLYSGRLSDLANLAWAKNAVLTAAERELEWEAHQRLCKTPSKCPEKRGVSKGSAPPVAQTGTTLPGQPSDEKNTSLTERADEAMSSSSPSPCSAGVAI